MQAITLGHLAEEWLLGLPWNPPEATGWTCPVFGWAALALG